VEVMLDTTVPGFESEHFFGFGSSQNIGILSDSFGFGSTTLLHSIPVPLL
jgi:hypothetical protein